MFTTFVHFILFFDLCSRLKCITFFYNFFTSFVYNQTFVENFCSQLLFIILDKNFCLQLLFTSFVHFFFSTDVHSFVHKFGQLFWSQISFKTFNYHFFTTFVNKFCWQLLLTLFGYNLCSQLLISNFFSQFSSKRLFTTFVHSFHLQLFS